MELKQKLDELGGAFDEFKKINDERLKQIEEKGTASADIEEKMQKAEKHMKSLEDRIEELKTALNRQGPGQGGDSKEDEKMKSEYKQAVQKFMSKGVEVPRELLEYAAKSMSVDSDEDGGFFVSPEVSGEISKKVFESSPIRQLASVQTISSDALEIMYDGDEAGSGWVGETQARTETSTPQVKKIVIPVHELYAEPRATQKLLDDAGVNLEAWLGGKVSEKFMRDEATAFISGNGMNKPKGILAYASASEGFDQVEAIRTANVTSIVGDDLIGVQASLKEAYQNNASWLINRLIVGEIRKLKDGSTNQYIWQPGLTAGQPNQLLSKPVYFANDLDSTAASDNFTAIYGDFRMGYQIVDRIGIRVLRDAYTAKPYVKFYTTKRVGGGVKLFEAMKIMQQKNS